MIHFDLNEIKRSGHQQSVRTIFKKSEAEWHQTQASIKDHQGLFQELLNNP